MDDLTLLTLTEAAALIRQRAISPVELTQAYLKRTAEANPRLNCFITLTEETALRQAEQCEAEILRGSYRGPLHGIPIALKDLYETAGVRTTAGSKFFAGYVPETDARVVQKLAAAGAVFLGKLNMHEIALGITNVNPHYGPSRNPWMPDRITGGSSGGSAAALAARLCLGSFGTDTGGSIRIPASLCGVVGLKPTYGRISLHGVIPLSWNLDHAGPMARNVRDAAVLYHAAAGYDPADPSSVNLPVEDVLTHLADGVRGMRVALAAGDFFAKADPEILQAVRTAAEVFAQAGAQVEEIDLPNAYQAAQTNGSIVVSDAAAFHRERLLERPQDFGSDVRRRLQTGAALPLADYVLARRAQVELRRQYEDFFRRVDLLLTPATPISAPPIAGVDAVGRAPQLTRFTAPFNLTGLPALSLPCGFTREGLPVGLQLVGGPWSEAKVLRAAYAYEQAAG